MLLFPTALKKPNFGTIWRIFCPKHTEKTNLSKNIFSFYGAVINLKNQKNSMHWFLAELKKITLGHSFFIVFLLLFTLF